MGVSGGRLVVVVVVTLLMIVVVVGGSKIDRSGDIAVVTFGFC